MAIELAFKELGLHRLEANIQPGNLASIALVKRLGFKQEGYSQRYLKIGGEWRDHERWALLADSACPPPLPSITCASTTTKSSQSISMLPARHQRRYRAVCTQLGGDKK